MAAEDEERLPAGRIPEAHRFVSADGGEAAPIRGPGHSIYNVAMVAESGESPAAAGFPETHRLIIAGRGEVASIG